MERALAVQHQVSTLHTPELIGILHNLANVAVAQHDPATALRYQKQAVDVSTALHGDNDKRTIASIGTLADILMELNQFDAAVRMYKRGLAWQEHESGPSHVEVAVWLDDLGRALLACGRAGSARQRFNQALALRERAYGEGNFSVAVSLNDLAQVAMFQRDFDQALPLLERAAAITERTLPESADLQTLRERLERCRVEQRQQPTHMLARLWQRIRRS
jgi:tetratricopeptide (TPR) repeat protein